MKNKFVLFIILIVLTLFATTSATYAFFNNREQIKTEYFETVGVQDVAVVSTEKELILISRYLYNNSANQVSTVESRHNLKLGGNIILTKDIIFTSDFNLDLNGFTLDLSGRNFLVRHSFWGNTTFANGDIINSNGNGKIIFETPLSVPIVSANINAEVVVYYSYNETVLSQKIFEMVNSKINAESVTKYFNRDLVLPRNYYGYDDVVFQYTSSNPLIVSNEGKVLNTSSTQTLTINLDLEIKGNIYSQQYEIIVVGDNDISTRLQVGRQYVIGAMSSYKIINEEIYIIKSDMMLPTAYTYFDLTLSYKSLDNTINRNVIEEDFYQNIVLSRSNPRSLYVEVMVSYLTNTFTFDIQINVIIADKYEIVNGIIEDLGILIVYDLDTIIPLINVSDYFEVGLIGLDYELINLGYNFIGNEEEFYYIHDNSIKVNHLPSDLDTIILEIGFTFTGDVSIKRYIRINLQGSDGGGAGVDSFYVYYLYLDALLSERTKMNYTYTSFNMPAYYSFWDGRKLYFEYDIVIGPTNILSLGSDEEFWYLNINVNNIPYQDTIVTVRYIDPFTEGGEIYTITSTFTIAGIVRQGTGTNEIPDINLYNAMKDFYGDENEAYLLASQLSKAADIFTVNLPVANFTGINRLTNTYGFNFNSTGFDNNDLIHLNGLNNINRLYLANNNLTSIITLPVLPSLYFIDLSSNNIDWFDPLLKLPSLTEANIYYNIGSTANYGSEGGYNSDVLIQLTIAGVDIYNQYNSVADQRILFQYNEYMITASRVLNSIIYQKVASSIAVISRPTTIGAYTIQYTNLTTTRYVARVAVNGFAVFRIFDIIIG